MNMLEIKQLVKTFRHFSLGPLDISIKAGCCLGLIGANGAGKSTLFRSVMGTLSAEQGEIYVVGKRARSNQADWKSSIGYVGDYTPLFDSWTGHKNLEAYSRFYSNWSQDKAKELARRLQLDLNLRAKNYSTGQRTKLAIVIALSHMPKLLLLDEPTAGLDPLSRDVFMEILFEVMEPENVAVLYATHHISEIEQLADRLVFLHEGNILRDEIKEDLSEAWRKITFRTENLPKHIPNVVRHNSNHPYHELISENGAETLRFLSESGIHDAETSHLSIEKITVEILRQTTMENSHV